MAEEAELVKAGIRIAESLHRYAQTHGWKREDYRIFATANTNWDTIHLLFVSDHVDENRKSDMMREMMKFIREDLRGVPRTWRSHGLILTKRDGYVFFADPVLEPGEVEIPDEILNPGVRDFRGPFRTTTR